MEVGEPIPTSWERGPGAESLTIEEPLTRKKQLSEWGEDSLVLGIETSCDETSAAIVEETGDCARPWRVRSNVVASQVAIHQAWGGIVPELSARQHIRDICGVIDRALAEAGPPDTGARPYDLIAVTQGPGLVGSLLVGLSFAKALAWSQGVPLVPVHRLAGHIE